MDTNSHSFFEDVLALFCASSLITVGLTFYEVNGLLTGGIGGIALLGAHFLPLEFGHVFFIANIPFFWLAWKYLGRRFAINTFVSVTMISLLSEQIHNVVQMQDVHPLFSAIVGGMLIGVGMIIMFRHKASFGGIGILAYYLQNRFNIKAGNFQLAADCAVLTSTMVLFDLQILLLSVLGAATLNTLISVNHKPGRYHVHDSIKKETNNNSVTSRCSGS